MEGRWGRTTRTGEQGAKRGRGGSSYLPTITCRACCLAETACSPSTSVATSLSCMRHVRLTCMAVRSTQAWPGGWIRRNGRRPVAKPTTDHSTVPWPNARGPVQSPSSDAREQTTYLRQLYHSVVRDVKCPGSLPAVLQPARHVRPSTVRQHATQRAEDRVGDPTTWVRTIFSTSLFHLFHRSSRPSSPRGLD